MYTDGTYDHFEPRQSLEIISFVARKSFNYIKINAFGSFTTSPVGNSNEHLIDFNSFILSSYSNIEKYSPYKYEVITHEAQSTSGDISYSYVCKYDMIFSSEEDFTATYVDSSYDTSSIIDMIKTVNDAVDQNTDHCGLIENYGDYIYLDDISNANENASILSKDNSLSRNGHASAKIIIGDYESGSSPMFVKALENITSFESVKYVSFQLYIDKTLYSKFYENNGIEIKISSDKANVEPSNYYSYNIGSGLFVQGWNTIKLEFKNFTKTGTPDIKSIRQIRFSIATNNFTAGGSLWMNSIILNQRMKPTVLFAFDGTYDTAFDYQYPLMYANNIPATVFINDRNTWTKDYMNNICNLIYTYGWDLGDFGCNPNKELLIEDDNPREQYMALKSAKEYITDNYTSDPISYSASLGNLRPITVPILKSLGFKIAKAESSSLCSFFGKDDFTLPMCLLSNTTSADAVIDKIDEAVSTGQCIVIYTNNVTEYGDEIAASKTSFEKVLNYIINLVRNDQLQCLTFRDFYNKCVNE